MQRNLNEFTNELNALLSDQIENFVWKWFDALAKNCKVTLATQYELLLNSQFQNTIRFTDEAILCFYQSHQNSILDITPYEINRIFLHAIITPINQWTFEFAGKLSQNSTKIEGGLFPKVLEFVIEQFNQNTEMSIKLKHSYPRALFQQLNFLQKEYRRMLWANLSPEDQKARKASDNNIYDENERPRPHEMIILPDQIRTAEIGSLSLGF